MQTIKIVTYNIHKGFGPGKVRFSLHKMRDALHDVDADLVFLQEVQGEHRRAAKRIESWPDASQFDYLAEELWPHVAYGKNAIYQAGHHGNAILSKYPFDFHENISVTSITRASRSLLHGVIKIADTDKSLHVLCIHLGLFKHERLSQLQMLQDRILQYVPFDEPLIIAGDFNDWRSIAVDYLEAELGMREVFKEMQGDYAKTFPAIRPTLRTDRIYYRGVTLSYGECLTGKPWNLLSDHVPLLAGFTV